MKLYPPIFTALLFIMSVHQLCAMEQELTKKIVQQLEVPYTLQKDTTDTAPITTVSYSPDGYYVAAGSENGTVVIWNSATKKIIKTLSHSKGIINALSWNSNGTRLAVAANNGLVGIYDANTWSLINSCQLYGPATSMSYSPNNQELAVSIQKMNFNPLKGDNFSIAVVDASTLNVKKKYADPSNSQPSTSLEELEKQLNKLHVYWTLENKLIGLKSHGKFISSVNNDQPFTLNCLSRPLVAAYSPNGTALAVGTQDGKIYLYDIVAKTCYYISNANKKSPIKAVCWNSMGTRIATATKDEINIWDTQTKTCIYTLKAGATISSLCWHSENSLIAAAGNALHLWCIKDREAAECNLRNLTPEETAFLNTLNMLYIQNAPYSAYKQTLNEFDCAFKSLNPTVRLALEALLPPVEKYYKDSLTTGAKLAIALGLTISGYILWKSGTCIAHALYTPSSAPQ